MEKNQPTTGKRNLQTHATRESDNALRMPKRLDWEEPSGSPVDEEEVIEPFGGCLPVRDRTVSKA